MEHAPQQVEGAKLADNAITDRLIIDFWREAAEHLVPDDEDARIIGIEIARIGRVVNPVVAGRVHHCLKPAREAADRLGVNPELVDQVDAADKGNHRRMEADQHQRQTEEERARDEARPGLPERSGEVIMLA